MAYSIVVREEPRWIESTFYNVYNMLLSFALLLSGIYLKVGIYRVVHISSEDIFIDDYNFSESLGKVNIEIIKCFLQKNTDYKRCSDLYAVLNEKGIINSKASNWKCGECLEKNYTVTGCPKYKNIDNRIREIRKLFESLEIGTILYPENKMKILSEGWKLRFFNNVRISLRDGKSRHHGRVNK